MQRRCFTEESHEEIANSLYHIGVLHFEEGNYEESLNFAQDCLVMRRNVLPEKHGDIAYSLLALSDCCIVMRMLEDAGLIMEQLEIWCDEADTSAEVPL